MTTKNEKTRRVGKFCIAHAEKICVCNQPLRGKLHTLRDKREKTGRVCLGGQMKVGGFRTPYQTMYPGFTLAEAMMAIVVLGIAATSLLVPFSSGARLRAEGMHRTLGARLASHLMEQIITKPFLDPDGSAYDFNPGPDAGDTVFDNIDDYDGYSESQGQVKNAAGEVMTDLNYAKFSREVSCQYVCVPQQPDKEEHQCNFILVTVTVRWDGKDIAMINRLVSQ